MTTEAEIATPRPKAKRAGARKPKVAANTVNDGAASAMQASGGVSAPSLPVSPAARAAADRAEARAAARKAKGFAAPAMPSPQAVTVALHQRRITRDKLLMEWPELADDEDALIDTLDGITSDDAVLAAMIEAVVAREDRAAARAERVKRIRAEAAADEAAAAKGRRAIANFLEASGRAKFEHAGIRASVRPGQPELLINDDELPAAWKRTPPPPAPSPDRVRIREALKGGATIPGARLGNGATVLTILA